MESNKKVNVYLEPYLILLSWQRANMFPYYVVGLLPSCKNNMLAIQWQLFWNLYLCEDYILLVPDVCGIIGWLCFFLLMHLYKCMNVMFIVLIFLVWLSITIFEVALLWLLYYNQSKLLLILCGSRIADGGNELYSLLAIKIFKATGYLRWCTGRNSATLRLIGNRLSC